jgi:hypothetical protein
MNVKALTECLSTLTGVFGRKNDFRKRRNNLEGRLLQPGSSGSQIANCETLRTYRGGVVEIAFDHEDGDIVVEAGLAAEICRTAKNIFLELFRGP